MIRVTFYRDRDADWKGFSVTGHAGSGVYGRDIVCAGVSALTLNAMNALQELTDQPMIAECLPDGGMARLKLTEKPDPEAKILLDAFELGIRNIFEDNNKTYIQIRYKEV